MEEDEFLFPDKKETEKQYVQKGDQISMVLVGHKTPVLDIIFSQ